MLVLMSQGREDGFLSILVLFKQLATGGLDHAAQIGGPRWVGAPSRHGLVQLFIGIDHHEEAVPAIQGAMACRQLWKAREV